MQKISRPAFAFFVSVLLLALLVQGSGSSLPTQTATHTSPSPIVKNHIHATSYSLEISLYTTTPNLLKFATPYIYQVKNSVTSSPQIYTKFDPITRKNFPNLLDQYDTARTPQKRTDAVVPLSSTPTPGTNKCKKDLANANWWGITIYLDHCSIVGLGNVKGITTAAGGIAVALDAFGIGIPIAVAIGILNLYSGVLAKEDYDCGNNGAYLNVTWLIVAWVAPVC